MYLRCLFFLYFPKSKPLSPLTRTTVALTGLLTPTLFFFTLKKFFFKVSAALGCCTQTFYSCGEQGLFCSCSPELCVPVAALVTARAPGHGAPGVVACGLDAHGVFLDQGSDLSPLHWRAASQPWTRREAHLHPLSQSRHSFSAQQPSQPGPAAPLLDSLGWFHVGIR